MPTLTSAQHAQVEEIARRHGFGVDAALAMLEAVIIGQGGMAQFGHAEFGGFGQWMRGGMTMVGDMFNDRLKGRVAALCSDLADLVAREPALAKPPDRWWPPALGSPDSAGAQDDMRYAYFASKRRLALDLHGKLTLYDTLDHEIHGVAQQQSGRGTLTFTSQHGSVDITALPVVQPS